MALPPLSIAVLDTETTGFLPRIHRVMELAIVRIERDGTRTTYDSLLSIGAEEIPPHVRVLTRIRQEDLKGKPAIGEEAKKIATILDGVDVIVGQNISFDMGMLKGEKIDLTDRPSIDTAMLAALVFPELPSFSLPYMSRVLKLTHEPAHRAMGDVRATLELLERCWERLLELPEKERSTARAVMSRAPEGYRKFFGALPEAKKKASLPAWFTDREPDHRLSTTTKAPVPDAEQGKILIQEEHVTCPLLEPLLHAAQTAQTRWIAVKNIEAAAERLPPHKDTRILLPPQLLLDPDAAERFGKQKDLTADEATVALKLAWFSPTTRLDVTLHAGERAVWNGKLACTERSDVYCAQFKNIPGTLLLDHRQLLSFLADLSHAAHGALKPGSAVVVDDASMLEDTATKAYGRLCPITDLRAAAEGDSGLTRFTDLLELWTEATRRGEDVRYLTKPDLDGREAKGLREQTGMLLADKQTPDRARHYLEHLVAILDPANLPGRITWIETMKHDAKILHAVPERVDQLLQKELYDAFAVTLIAPAGSELLPEIVPPQAKTTRKTAPACGPKLPIAYPAQTMEDLFLNPPAGKTIVLATSKRMIEDWFVKHAERLEERGVTLICQGLSGGQGRMEESFLAADAPAIWILTPWLYEGIDLSPGSADHLVVDSLPFDHPSHPVLSIRARHWRDAFDEYSMPRLRSRLFRLLRTFARHRTDAGDVTVLDKRLETKAYGRILKSYLAAIAEGAEGAKPSRKSSAQPSLF